MRSFVALLVIFGLIAGYSLSATAADTYEPANPFTQPEPSSRGISANISDNPVVEEKPGFKLPKLSLPKLPKPSLPKFEMPKLKMPKVSMPQWTKKEEVTRRSGPSTWDKLNNGTKSMFTKTRDTLMPWAAKDKKPPARSVTGSRNSTGFSRTRVASNRNDRESSSEKKSFFGSLLPSPAPEEKRIETTSDFLSQKRPRFD
jgi:hypothetical protein